MSTLKVNNIVAYSGTHVSGTFSGVFSGSFNSSRIDALEAFSSSLDNTFATDLIVNSLSGAFNSFTSALDNTYATDAQLLPILQATRSIELTTGSIQIQTASLLQFTASQDSRNLTLSTVTGSLIGITNGLMAFTAALDNTYATDAQLYQLYQATASLNTYTGSNDSVMSRILQTTASLNTYTGSARIELNSIEAYTASLKAATLISSSAQITNLGYATTGSNVFIGSQTMSGSLNVSSSVKLSTTDAFGDSLDLIIGNTNAFGTTGYQINASGSTENPLWLISNEAAVMIARGTVSNTGDTCTFALYTAGYPNAQPNATLQLYTSGSVPTQWFYESTATSNFPGDINIGYINDTATTSGSLNIRNGNINVTGSVNIDNVIKLAPVTNFPNGQAGMLVASASYGKTNLYVYDGSDWKWLVTGSIA